MTPFAPRKRAARAVSARKNLRAGRAILRVVAICVCILFFPFGTLRQTEAQISIASLSSSARSHFAAGEAAQKQKNDAQAEQQYRTVIALAPRFAPAYLNLGLVYQNQERWREATQMFHRAVKLDPSLTGAQFFLGVDYCLQGQPQLAVPRLEAALHQNPRLEDAYSWLATAHKMDGDLESEVTTLHQGLRHYPSNIDMLYLLGRAYEMLGRNAMDRLEKSNRRSSYVEQWLGEDYARTGYPSAGLVRLHKAIAISPRRPGLHVEVGEIFLEAGKLSEALKEFNLELQLNPASVRALTRRGEVEFLDGHVNLALADWSRALATDPLRVEKILGLRRSALDPSPASRLPDRLVEKLSENVKNLEGNASRAAQLARFFISVQQGPPAPASELASLSADGSSREADACGRANLKKWLAEDRLSAVAACAEKSGALQLSPAQNLEVARALFLQGKPQQAILALKRLPMSSQSQPGALYWSAQCYKELAVEAYAKLFQTAPDSYRAHELLGNVDTARHQDAQAIQEYQKALAERPALPNLHYEIGHLLWKVFKVPEARKEFDAELRLNPRHAGALLDMGATYLYEHQPAKALSYLVRAEKLDPTNDNAHEFLGIAYLQLGKYTQAETELQKALASDRDGKVHFQLGKVYQALGQKQKAKQEFADAAKLNLESSRRNQERTEQLNTAGASLKQP